MIQLFIAQSPALATGPQAEPAVSGMPRAVGKLRLAPFEPVCKNGRGQWLGGKTKMYVQT